MAEEHKENVDPVYKYVDGKIKLLKREIKQLKAAHEAVANKTTQDLHELEQVVCGLKVNADIADFTSIIDHQFPNKKTIRAQTLTDASVAKTQIKTSDNPWRICNQFHNKCVQTLRDLGADFINF